jgi:hypothetical protein
MLTFVKTTPAASFYPDVPMPTLTPALGSAAIKPAAAAPAPAAAPARKRR